MAAWRRKRSDFDEEIASHIELEAERLVAEGWAEEEARWEARRRFGNVTRARERFHHARVPQWLDALLQDLRYAWRQVGRAPLFAAGVVLTLALGIGANAIVFGVVDRLLLRPPAHVAEPLEVRRVYLQERSTSRQGEIATIPVTSFPMVTLLREQVPAYSAVAGVRNARAGTLGRGPDAEEVRVAEVTGNFFQLLGVRPARGRFFGPDEDRVPVGSPVAVVSDAFWRGRLGADTAVVGREILVDRTVLTVVGVAPRGFTGLDLDPVDVWVPVSVFAAGTIGEDWATEPGNIWIRAVGRLAAGATPAQADAQATAAYRRALPSWEQPWRDSLGTVVGGSVLAARSPAGMPGEAKVSLWLVGVSGIVLLIACANVASLLLARAVRRRREIAVRLALGVSRGRLVRQLLGETLVLALLSTGAALLFAHWGGGAVRALLLPDVAWDGSPVDPRVLAFTLAVTLATVALAGLLPALQASRLALADALKAGARDGGARRTRLGHGLLVAQTALAVALVVGAGLFVLSLQRVGALDVGIDRRQVLLVHTSLAAAGADGARATELWREAAERVRRLPGVEGAALVGASVPTRSARAIGAAIPGRDSLPSLSTGGPYGAVIDGDYFRALGARIVEGRSITPAEERAGARVVVVNETLARSYWSGASPVGACLRLGEDPGCSTVVGVVQDVLSFAMVGDERGMLYLPIGHPAAGSRRPGALVVRLGDDASPAAVALVQRELQHLVPDMSYVSVRTFEDLVAPELRPWRLGATMFTAFGALALLIAAVGLYSVLAYAVSQRAHEMGVRLALGARRLDVVGLVVREGVGVAALGLLAGLALAAVGGRYVESLLYGTSPREPAVLGAAAASLLVVALAASLLPAWRAARVDPARTLREE